MAIKNMEGDGENEDMTYEQDTEDHEEGCTRNHWHRSIIKENDDAPLQPEHATYGNDA